MKMKQEIKRMRHQNMQIVAPQTGLQFIKVM